MRTLLPFVLLLGSAVQAVPVVPQFTQGTQTTNTETVTKITETINSIDINTGWQYTVTGTNMKHSGSSVSPTTIAAPSQTTDGITYTWVGLDHSNKPNWELEIPGSAFQFTETYAAPGVASQTIIQRTTDQTSITDTTSIFQQ
jgi:hypothetical protein|tara:strand:- start:647 stop:1075 length:429 start_codon:yes stop_codon:yes gene_type:complete